MCGVRGLLLMVRGLSAVVAQDKEIKIGCCCGEVTLVEIMADHYLVGAKHNLNREIASIFRAGKDVNRSSVAYTPLVC